VSDVSKAVEKLKLEMEKVGGEVLQVEDKYATPMKSGYVGVHVNVLFTLPSGKVIRGEIQIHDHEMSVKGESEQIYQVWREAKSIPDKVAYHSVSLYKNFMENFKNESIGTP
jgi:hypothetical protein